MLSQENEPKRHRSAREILCETSILRSSVHRIIHHNLQLKCVKRRRAQPIASPISCADKQSYRLQSGAAPRFESGGDNFASGASKKNVFDPPTFWPVGGDKILLR